MESSDSEADTSLNDAEKTDDSKISGVSPFFSAEEINVSIATTHTCYNNNNNVSFLSNAKSKILHLKLFFFCIVNGQFVIISHMRFCRYNKDFASFGKPTGSKTSRVC